MKMKRLSSFPFLALCAFCIGSPTASANPAAIAAALAEAAEPSAGLAAGSGFYRVEHTGGDRWRMLDPEGRPFVPLGVDQCRPEPGELARYGSISEWAESAAAKLRAWGFTALGARCAGELYSKGLPALVYPWFGEPFALQGGDKAILQGMRRPGTSFPNVFHTAWPQYCRDHAMKNVHANRYNKDILGWFFDNELAWWGGNVAGQGKYGLVDAVAALPPDHSARRAYDAFAAEHVGWPRSRVCGEFMRLIAEKYFGCIVPALREADPNHLILGCRFSGVWMEPELLETAGKWLDVISFNHYPWVNVTNGEVRVSYREGDTSALVATRYREMFALARRPFLVTEWSFPANDVPGIENRWGEGMKMPTQAERVAASEIFARELMAQPFVLGYNYFMWHDSSPGGGENCNYGLVDNQGEPYAPLTEMFSRVQSEIKAGRAAEDAAEPPRFKGLERVNLLGDGGSVWCFSERGGIGMLSTVFVSPEGKVLVIDGGRNDNGDGAFLLKFLRSIGGKVDYWFITHAHNDHFGALAAMHKGADAPLLEIGELIYDFPEREWLEAAEPSSKPLVALWFDEFMGGAGAKIPRGDCSPGRKVALGSWSFEIVNGRLENGPANNVNATSICLTVNAGGKRWLITGDTEGASQKHVLAALAGRERHDVVFMSHHGQRGANKEFYAAIAPEIAVWPTSRRLWDNKTRDGTAGSADFRTNYVKCWLQELGIRRQYILDHDVVFE